MLDKVGERPPLVFRRDHLHHQLRQILVAQAALLLETEDLLRDAGGLVQHVLEPAQVLYAARVSLQQQLRLALVDDRLHAACHAGAQRALGQAELRRHAQRRRARLAQHEVDGVGSVARVGAGGGWHRLAQRRLELSECPRSKERRVNDDVSLDDVTRVDAHAAEGQQQRRVQLGRLNDAAQAADAHPDGRDEGRSEQHADEGGSKDLNRHLRQVGAVQVDRTGHDDREHAGKRQHDLGLVLVAVRVYRDELAGAA